MRMLSLLLFILCPVAHAIKCENLLLNENEITDIRELDSTNATWSAEFDGQKIFIKQTTSHEVTISKLLSNLAVGPQYLGWIPLGRSVFHQHFQFIGSNPEEPYEVLAVVYKFERGHGYKPILGEKDIDDVTPEPRLPKGIVINEKTVSDINRAVQIATENKVWIADIAFLIREDGSALLIDHEYYEIIENSDDRRGPHNETTLEHNQRLRNVVLEGLLMSPEERAVQIKEIKARYRTHTPPGFMGY